MVKPLQTHDRRFDFKAQDPPGRRNRHSQLDLRAKLVDPPLLPAFEDFDTDQPLECLMARVRPRLRTLFASITTPADEAGDVLQEALWTLGATRQEVEEREKDLSGAARLRSMLFWRQRRRRICEEVDVTVREMLTADGVSPKLRYELQRELRMMIGGLPKLCRGLLLMRYGLEVDTDQVAIKLGQRKASVRKLTQRCLRTFCRSMIELGVQRTEA